MRFSRASVIGLLVISAAVTPCDAASNVVPEEFRGRWVPSKATCGAPVAVLVTADRLTLVNGKDTEALGPLLRRVQADTGAAIVIIEHDMALLTTLCDKLVALENGSVIYEGTPAEVLAHPRVIESYLGVEESAIQRSGSRGKKKAPAARKAAKRKVSV